MNAIIALTTSAMILFVGAAVAHIDLIAEIAKLIG